MKKFGVSAALTAGLVLVALVATSAVEAATRPPKNLKLVGDHWTPTRFRRAGPLPPSGGPWSRWQGF